MNKAMNEQVIRAYFSSIGKTLSNNFLYAYVEPGNLDLALFGAISFIKMKNFIAAFYSDEIIIAPLTLTSDFDITENPIIIREENIDSLKIKKGIIQYVITIVTKSGKLKLKCNKKIALYDWQASNLKYLDDNKWLM